MGIEPGSLRRESTTVSLEESAIFDHIENALTLPHIFSIFAQTGKTSNVTNIKIKINFSPNAQLYFIPSPQTK